MEELVKGANLSVSCWRVSQLEGAKRMDAEFYQPHYLGLAQRLSVHKPLSDYVSLILHPVEIRREYEDAGIQILLAQNIRANYFDFSTTAFMPLGVEPLLRKNKLICGDVGMTRSGVNYGDAACYDGEPSNLFACADCLVIRPKGVSGIYLATFFNTEPGRTLIKRGAYGTAQPHVAPEYLRTLRIPRDEHVECLVERKLKQAGAKFQEAVSLYTQAQRLLTETLELNQLDVSESLFSVRRLSDVFTAKRLDAEYFQARYERLEDLLRKCPHGFESLGDLCKPPVNGVEIREYVEEGVPYLRVGDLRQLNVDEDSVVYIDPEAAKEVQNKVALQKGDVLATRSGSLGMACVISEAWRHAIISSHLIRLRIKHPAVDPYYLALFLNSTPGAEQIRKRSNGGVQPEINQPSLKSVVVPLLAPETQKEICSLIQQSHAARRRAKELLAEAKAAVEKMIEQSR